MRFLASADWQLGMTAHYLGEEARPRFHQARFDAVRRIGELAADRDAAFVVVCGDVFESNQLDRTIMSRASEALRSVAVPVVFVPGNHDPLDAASIYDSAEFKHRMPEHVHVLRDSASYEVVPGVEIVGAPWFSKRPASDLVAEACESLEPAPSGITRVIAGHGAVSTLDPDRDSPATIDVPTLQQTLDAGGAHLAVLGDRHSTYEVGSRIWYPGTPEVTHRREDDPGNVLVVDLDGTNAQVEKEHVGTWVFTTLEEQVRDDQDVELLKQRLDGMPDKECTAVWLAPSGTITTAAKARLDSVLEEASDLFARLDHWERHTDLAVMPDDHDFADLGLGGFVQEALTELTELAKSDEEGTQTAQDALGLLYRFAGGAR